MISSRRASIAAACLLLFLATAQAPAAEETGWDFDRDPVGGLPPGFVAAVGDWKIVETPEGRALAQTARNADPVFNVLLVDGTRAGDLELSVRLRPVAGEYDRGGGLIWRAKDARNYYIARFNPLEDNFRVYTVVDGKRTQLATADVRKPSGWVRLRVTMTGDHIACELDGAKLLDVRDATFPGPGKIGLWSKSDAQTEFDDLTLRAR